MKKQYIIPSAAAFELRSAGMLAVSLDVTDNETVDQETDVLSAEKEFPWQSDNNGFE